MMALHYQILVCCGDRHPDAELYFAFIATDAIAFFKSELALKNLKNVRISVP